MKECSYCYKTLPDSEFRKSSRKCKECIKVDNRRYYEQNQQSVKNKQKAWREHNPLRLAYAQQADNAAKRGIDWQFTFDSWIKWWGADLEKRGCTTGDLVMARYGDTGPYAHFNCFKSEASANARDGSIKKFGKLFAGGESQNG